MSQFHNENHGEAFALLFDSHNVEDRFKRTEDKVKYWIVKDKEEQRLSAMLDTSADLGCKSQQLHLSAITCIDFAASQSEALSKQLGLVAVVPSGVLICPGCLDRAIFTCEENLNVLKDIKEATKKYETVK